MSFDLYSYNLSNVNVIYIEDKNKLTIDDTHLIIVTDNQSLKEYLNFVLNVYMDVLSQHSRNYSKITIIKTFPKVLIKDIDLINFKDNLNVKEIIKSPNNNITEYVFNHVLNSINQITINSNSTNFEIHYLTKENINIDLEIDLINNISKKYVLKIFKFVENFKSNEHIHLKCNIIQYLFDYNLAENYTSYLKLFEKMNFVLFDFNNKTFIDIDNLPNNLSKISLNDTDNFIIYKDDQIKDFDICINNNNNFYFTDNLNINKCTDSSKLELIYNILLHNVLNLKLESINNFYHIIFIDKIYKEYIKIKYEDKNFEYKYTLAKIELIENIINNLNIDTSFIGNLYFLIKNMQKINSKFMCPRSNHIIQKRIIDNIYEMYNFSNTKTSFMDNNYIRTNNCPCLLLDIDTTKLCYIIGSPIMQTNDIATSQLSMDSYLSSLVKYLKETDCQNLNGQTIVLDNGKSYNAILPLYLNSRNWSNVKIYLNFILGIIGGGHPLNFSKSHINIYFVTLIDMTSILLKNTPEFSDEYITQYFSLLRTCHEIMIERKYHIGIEKFLLQFMNDRKERKKTDYKKLLGQLISIGYFFNKHKLKKLIDIIKIELHDKNNDHLINALSNINSTIKTLFDNDLIKSLDNNNGRATHDMIQLIKNNYRINLFI